MRYVQFSLTLLHPKYLFFWVAIFIWWLLVMVLPYRLQMKMGSCIGLTGLKVGKRRRAIAEQNIDACFAEKSYEDKQALLRESFKSLGKSFFESGIAWFWPAWRLRGMYTISGLEHLKKAQDDKQGVLFLAVHFTPIEICAAFINQHHSIDGFYHPHKNSVYEYVQSRGRTRHNSLSETIPRKNVRAAVRALKKCHVLNYAADQDYGANNSVFIPFFGILAATVTAPSKLVSLTNAKVIPYSTLRREDGSGYSITIYPPMEGFGKGGEVSDAHLINQFVEARVRENHSQYLWVHRRFKSRPEGEKEFYTPSCNKK